ncbi:hypothetical protein BsWGS_21653 [Bradybaena similaris]
MRFIQVYKICLEYQLVNLRYADDTVFITENNVQLQEVVDMIASKCPNKSLSPTTFSSYSPCHVALVIMPAHSLLSRVQPIISEIDIPPCHEAKLPNIISLGLFLPHFPSNLPVDTAYSSSPLLIT